MAGFDGNGNYLRSYSWLLDAANNINITASRFDTEDNGFAAALSIAVTRDGQGKMTADFLPAVDNTLNMGTALKRWTSFNGVPAKQITAGIPVNALQFGAVGDGIADDSAALNAAFSSGAAAVFLPPLNYRCASGLLIPGQCSVYSFGFQPTNPPSGTRLTFDLGVATCVTMGGPTSTNQSCSLRGVSILRAAGTPPAGSIGLLNQNTYATLIEDVASMGHAIPLKLSMNAAGSAGITCIINRFWTGAANDAHVVLDSWPEARFNQCRFGMNGSGDLTVIDFIRIQGGTSNPAGGPDSIFFTNCQFNQGVNSGTNWLAFKNFLVGSASVGGLYSFSQCYIENDVVGIFSDATWVTGNGAFAGILQFMFDNCVFNPTSSAFQFLALNANTQINNMLISNSQIKCAFTYNGNAQLNTLTINGSQISGAVSLTGVSNSVAVLCGNQYGNGLTLAGNWASLNVMGGAITGGALTNTATGSVKVDVSPNNALQTFTPTLLLGGAAVGMTTSLAAGAYQVEGNRVWGEFSMTLTAKGSSVGGATIGNLPFALNGSPFGGSGGGMINFSLNMSALTAAPMMLSIAAGQQLNIYQQTATGLNAVTDGNITNTTQLHGTFEYFK